MKAVLFFWFLSFFSFGIVAQGNESIDYSQAMRMSVKFFGGQRCGNTHNWLLKENDDITVAKVCHTLDAYEGLDMSGGWHDCGDHIKVAHTMGYSAVCLLSAYDIWPRAFEDHHSQTYGEAIGIADVLDEVKVATDFFMKSLVNDEFVFYVGEGEKDHTNWVTSAYQSTLEPWQGGDARGVTATSTGGGWQAMNYATALAFMSMHYPDATYATTCLTEAKKLYDYALTHRSRSGVNCSSFYGEGNSQTKDEYALAAVIMHRATGELKYKEHALAEISGLWESNSSLAWDTVADIMYYYLVQLDANANNNEGGTMFSLLEKNVNQIINNANAYGISWDWYSSKWGTNKLASGNAFTLALYAKLIDDVVVQPSMDKSTEALAQNRQIVNYMLGTNEFNHPFIHGFNDDMTHRIHHRNAMGRDDNPISQTKNTCDYKFACGGLIGGPVESGVFHNLVEDGDYFMETEGGCDYNGPFVAALANIMASDAPVDIPSRVVEMSMINDVLEVYPNPARSQISIKGAAGSKVTVYNAMGVKVLTTQVRSEDWKINIGHLNKGLYILSDGDESYRFLVK